MQIFYMQQQKDTEQTARMQSSLCLRGAHIIEGTFSDTAAYSLFSALIDYVQLSKSFARVFHKVFGIY